jgi:hypothetical protein
MQLQHLRALFATAAALTIAVGGAGAQGEPKTLVRWDFTSDTQGWYAEHSMAPLSVSGGVLHGQVTGDDPYTICSKGQSFDIQGGDYQAVVIRAKVKDGGAAEFFWASSTGGRDLGFVAGKEIAFHMVADGRFHTYHVFPLWKGRVTRLRFDPPGGRGQEVWIDYIAIVEFPQPESLLAEPVWNFDRGLEGFVPQSDVESFHVGGGLVTLESFAGQEPTLLSPPLDGDTRVLRYLTIRCELTGIRKIVVSFAQEDAKFDPRRAVAVSATADGLMRTYLVETANAVGEAQRIKRLRVSFIATGEPAVARVDSIALGAQPVGPPQVDLTVVPENPTLFVGQPRKFGFGLQNVGSEPVGPVEVSMSSPAFGRVMLGVAGPHSLAPGEKWSGSLSAEPLSPGAWPVRVRVAAPPAAPTVFKGNLVVSRAVDLDKLPRPQGAQAVETPQALWIANDRVGLAVARNEDGYGPALLCIWDGQWKPMATIPALCEILGAGLGAEPVSVWPKVARMKQEDSGAAFVEMREQVASGDAVGTAKVFIRLDEGAPDFQVTATFTPSAAGRLLHFAGPQLLAGDGAFDGVRQEALFPGLEWLVRGEESSGTLDIAPPGNTRYAPHPNRITVPLMVVQSPDGELVGLTWDALERWDWVHDRPAAIFASPNFLDHQENHLMGLFLPSIPAWTDENRPRASRAYDLMPGRPLVLRQRIFALPGGTVRAAVQLWYQRYGTPPLPELPRSYDDDIALSIRGYEQVLYVKDKGWMGVKGWAPQPDPRVALHYILAAQVLGKNAPYTDMMQVALQRVGSQRDLALAAHVGGILQPLLDLRGQAYSIMASQDLEGGWYFQPDEEHRPLGEPGKTTLGTVAANVAVLLRAARIFHDPRLLAAGLKGLAFMERFTVPRGAQVWEVPLHTPDILAAAYGVDACLAGYLATDDEQYLRRAVYWAEAGLPFLYAWQAPEKGLEAMRYGSIPVFGATWYTGSWFGRIVQWNGLAFAASLQRLAPYDKTCDWRHIAEGVTRSGIIQQRLEPEYLGLYPDSISMLDGDISWGLMLGPQGILDNVFPLIGRDLDPHIETPSLAGGAVTLLVAGALSDIQGGPDRVRFSLRYPAGRWMYAALVGVSEPAQITAAGEALPRVEQLGEEQGYRYDPSLGIVEIKLLRADTPVAVEVRGIRAFGGEGARTAWDFKSGSQGWHAMHSMALIQVRNGVAVTAITADDPFMGVLGLDASAQEFGGVRIRLRTPRSGPAEVFFGAGGLPITAGSEKTFEVRGGEFRDYVVDLRDHPRWRGTVTALRIDPPGEPGDIVELESVAFVRRSELAGAR